MTPLQRAKQLEADNLRAEQKAIRAVSALYNSVSFRDLTALLADALDSPNSLTRIKRLDRLTAAYRDSVAALSAPPDALASLIPEVVRHTLAAQVETFAELRVSFTQRPDAAIDFTEGASLRLQRYWGAENERLASQVQSVLLEGLERGQGVRQVAASLRDRVEVSRYRSELVVANELGNASATVQRDTQIEAGITEFVWLSARDNRVRPEHRERNGQTYKWSDPPNGETPGSPIRCRCVSVAVIPD